MSDTGADRAYDIVRHPRARHLRLSIDPASGRARLTVPRRTALSAAIAWAETKAAWLAQQRAGLPRPRPFVPGAIITVADETLLIDHREDAGRSVRQVDGRLVVGGPAEAVPRRIATWLKRRALDLLTADTAHYAARAGVTVTAVTVGDPKGRWGSCAAHGAIRYSWRLVLAPSDVRRATAAHEVAHRIHMNHGPAFHALVADLHDGDPARARAWLRRHGAALHWFGRES